MTINIPAVVSLDDLVAYCQQRLGVPGFPDYPGAMNGLQVGNDGRVSRLGAAVDAGLEPFRRAAAKGIDFLIVHHGMFWEPPRPFVGVNREKLALLLGSNMAVYAAHLPLDAHPELGNNAQLARRLRLEPLSMFYAFEGRDVGLIASAGIDRTEFVRRLNSLFTQVTAIEFGAERPERVAIVTGGGYGAISSMRAAGVDTLITGELREHLYSVAQEEHLNLYACGHYATEVFGVSALAEELSQKFALPWEFVPTENPL